MNEIVTHFVVPSDHPSLPGHFPGRPIVPGVVLLDHVFSAIRTELGAATTVLTIVSTKFLRAVSPEMRIDVQIKFSADESGRWKARFTAAHGTEPVLEGSLLLAVERVA